MILPWKFELDSLISRNMVLLGKMDAIQQARISVNLLGNLLEIEGFEAARDLRHRMVLKIERVHLSTTTNMNKTIDTPDEFAG
jgi:hypothetical protein